jgi:transcription factor SPN1
MEDLEPAAEGSIQGSPLPQALDDPADPLNPDIEEENEPDAPISAPTQDVEATENKDDLSDDESVLSDIDEAQFGEFDADAVAIEERPIAVDENNIALIGTHKRKRAEGEEGEGRKKKREGKREKTKKSRRATSGDDADGDEGGKSSRRRRDDDGGEKRRARRPSPDENTLTPEESESGKPISMSIMLISVQGRKRALDKAMDEAVRNPNARRGKKKDEIVRTIVQLNDMQSS